MEADRYLPPSIRMEVSEIRSSTGCGLHISLSIDASRG